LSSPYFHDKTAVRSGAGTIQVLWTAVRSGAGTMQVLWTAVRSGAGTIQVLWTAVRSGAGTIQVLWTAVRRGAGTIQVLWTAVRSGAGTMQVLWTAVRSGAGTIQVLWTAVRRGAENGLLRLRLSVFQDTSLGDFLLAPACPIEKVTLWEGFLYLTSGSETDKGVVKSIHQAIASLVSIAPCYR